MFQADCSTYLALFVVQTLVFFSCRVPKSQFVSRGEYFVYLCIIAMRKQNLYKVCTVGMLAKDRFNSFSAVFALYAHVSAFV